MWCLVWGERSSGYTSSPSQPFTLVLVLRRDYYLMYSISAAAVRVGRAKDGDNEPLTPSGEGYSNGTDGRIQAKEAQAQCSNRPPTER